MRKIIFARHAKSSWGQPVTRDFDRVLNDQGRNDVLEMAKFIQQTSHDIQKIISSDAKRAIITAEVYKKYLTPEIDIQYKHVLYLASHQEIESVVEHCSNDFSSLMIVGHNPGMSEIVGYYINQNFQDMPACGVAIVEFDVDNWNKIMQKSGKLLAFEYPKKHRL